MSSGPPRRGRAADGGGRRAAPVTEAITTACPVALRVDRGAPHRRVEPQPRAGGQASAREVWGATSRVLTRHSRGNLERESPRAFEKGQIERSSRRARAGGAVSNGRQQNPDAREGAEVAHVITVGEDITDRVLANVPSRTGKARGVGRLAAASSRDHNPLATSRLRRST